MDKALKKIDEFAQQAIDLIRMADSRKEDPLPSLKKMLGFVLIHHEFKPPHAYFEACREDDHFGKIPSITDDANDPEAQKFYRFYCRIRRAFDAARSKFHKTLLMELSKGE